MDKNELKAIIDGYILEHGLDATKHDIGFMLEQEKPKLGRPKGSSEQIKYGLATIIQQLFGPFPYPTKPKLELPKNWRAKTIKFINDNPEFKSRIFRNNQKGTVTNNSWTKQAMEQSLSREMRSIQEKYYLFYLACKNLEI